MSYLTKLHSFLEEARTKRIGRLAASRRYKGRTRNLEARRAYAERSSRERESARADAEAQAREDYEEMLNSRRERHNG